MATPTERLVVYRELPPGWTDLNPEVMLSIHPTLLEMMWRRVPGQPVWFIWQQEPDATDQIGFFGLVMSGQKCYAPFNVREIVTGVSSVFRVDEAATQEMESLRSASPPHEAWHPHLLIALSGYDCFPVGPGAANAEMLQRFVHSIIQWAHEQQMALISFMFTEVQPSTLGSILAAAGFREHPFTFRADLELNGASFEEYLARIPGEKRYHLRRERRKLAEAGVQVHIRPVHEYMDAIVRLRCKHRQKYGHPAVEADERAWIEMSAREFGPQITLLTAEADDKVLSFCILIQQGETWNAFLTATDYDDPRARFAYFEVCFYRPVIEAPSHSIRRIAYGVGAEATKRWRGCTISPVGAWVKALNPALEQTLQQSAPILQQWRLREN